MAENYVQSDKKPNVMSLKAELATRDTASYITEFYNTLPNPDPVLRKAGIYIQTLREIRRDVRVSSATRSRKAGVFKRNTQITANGASDATVDFIGTVLKNINMRQAIREILDYWGYGYQVSEVVWANDGKDIIPAKIQGKPQEWFSFNAKGNYLQFSPMAATAEPVDNYKFLLTTNEADYTNPYGIGAYSDCFWPVTFKKGGVKFWARFVEKYGMPHVVGKLPRSASKPDQEALLEAMMLLIQNSASVVPDDSSVEILEAEKTSSTEAYQTFNTYHNAEISISILGHEGTQMSTPGKLGDDDTAQEVRSDIIDADCENVSETINTLIKWILELNPHHASGGIPTFDIYEDEDVDKTLAERDDILTRTGIRFKPSYYKRVYNLSDDDFEIASATPGAQKKAEVQLAAPEETQPPQSIEQIINRAQDEISHDDLIDTIRNMADNADTLEQFHETLLNEYPSVNEGEKIKEALIAAELAGRHDTMNDTGLIKK